MIRSHSLPFSLGQSTRDNITIPRLASNAEGDHDAHNQIAERDGTADVAQIHTHVQGEGRRGGVTVEGYRRLMCSMYSCALNPR